MGLRRAGAGGGLRRAGTGPAEIASGLTRDAASSRVRLTNLDDVLHLRKIATAAAAASQARSEKVRFTASMRVADNSTEVERDFDFFAVPSSTGDDETSALARLRLTYETHPLLDIQSNTVAGSATQGVVFFGHAAAGGSVAFDWRTVAAFGAEDPIMLVRNQAAGVFAILGGGTVNLTGELRVDNVKVLGNQGAALPADATDDASSYALANAMKARMIAHGLVAT